MKKKGAPSGNSRNRVKHEKEKDTIRDTNSEKCFTRVRLYKIPHLSAFGALCQKNLAREKRAVNLFINVVHLRFHFVVLKID